MRNIGRRLVMPNVLFALALLVGATISSAWIEWLILYFTASHSWPHGAPIPLLPDWTLTLPAFLTNRWWDVPLIAALGCYAVIGSNWIIRNYRHAAVAGSVSGGLLLIGIAATMTVTGQSSLLDATLHYVLPLAAILGAGAGFEYGISCRHDVSVSLIVAGVPAACLPGLWSYGLLPGLIIAGPLLFAFAISLAVGVSAGTIFGSPFRAFDHWLHPVH